MGNIKNISELLPDEPVHDPFEDEINFNNTVREYILFGTVLLLLSITSHLIVLRYRRKEISTPLSSQNDDDEAIVDRVALWLCTFSLSISLGSVLLLPISILTNEVLTIYRDSLYLRWINLSLIQGLWNMIFLFSNISLFVGLPFAYLFTESEGFPGSKKGLKARVVETVTVLCLLVVLVFGVAFIISFLLGYYEQETFAELIDVWGRFYLPFLYSLISCLGVLVLLLCTPVGFAHFFTALGQLVLKPTGFLRDLKEDYQAALLQEEALAHRLQLLKEAYANKNGKTPTNGKRLELYTAQPITRAGKLSSSTSPQEIQHIMAHYTEAKQQRIAIGQRKKAGLIKRTLAYPLAFLILLAMTGAAIVIVGLNTLQLLVGIKALPLSSAPAILGETQQGKRMVLLSMLGPMGAVLEVLLIFYLIAASILGCYSLPVLKSIKPIKKDTPMIHVIANCLVVLLLSSALPLLVRTLGITNFDLLGDYGEISWLGNFYIVLTYNILFASAAAMCLVQKFTVTLRHEIMLRFILVGRTLWKRNRFLSSKVLPSSLISGASNMKEE